MPKYIDTLLGKYSIILDLLKIIVLIFVVIVFFLKKIKLDKSLLFLFIYFIYIVMCTFFKGESILFVLKTYVTGMLSFVFIKIVSESKNKKDYYLHFTKILDFFLLINLIIILFNVVTKNSLFINDNYGSRFFLGSDNRFILYILIQTILYNYLLCNDSSKMLKRRMYFCCIINLITLFVVWSASALVIYVILLCFQFIYQKKKKKINIRLVLGIIIIIEILIVFFNIQNLFEYLIVNILHKSLNLSYRTYIWEKAINEITSNVSNLFFGHGFLDLTNRFFINTLNAYGTIISPIHLHNILINNLYMGGIFGTLLYFIFINSVVNKIILIKKSNIKLYNMYSVIIASIFSLLIFDVLELYAHYFIILALLCYSGFDQHDEKIEN
jgi:O-antigen ligase